VTAHRVVLLSSEWLGSEGARVVQEILSAAGVAIDWSELACGQGPLHEDALAQCRKADAILKGEIAMGERALPLSVELRRALGLWATVRPVQALPSVPARWPGLDLLCVRETSEDVYSGFEHTVTEGVYEAVKVTTRAASERIARFGYDLARTRGRKKVTIVHKANIMKRADGLFLGTAREVGKAYPDIVTDDLIVDALCMRLVRRPTDFDVLLLGNLFGDIVSDLCSGLAGGGVAATSASFGDGPPLFDDGGHGSADVEPIPMLRAAIWMVRHLGEEAAAGRIENALFATLEAGVRPVGLGGETGVLDMGDEVISRL
jgi:isocitrate dehydrogenase (NAD+)